MSSSSGRPQKLPSSSSACTPQLFSIDCSAKKSQCVLLLAITPDGAAFLLLLYFSHTLGVVRVLCSVQWSVLHKSYLVLTCLTPLCEWVTTGNALHFSRQIVLAQRLARGKQQTTQIHLMAMHLRALVFIAICRPVANHLCSSCLESGVDLLHCITEVLSISNGITQAKYSNWLVLQIQPCIDS